MNLDEEGLNKFMENDKQFEIFLERTLLEYNELYSSEKESKEE